MRKHKTKTVMFYGNPVEIDEQLAPLLPLLWEHDILTYQSCQEEHPGLACIEFAGSGDVMDFLRIAQRNYRVEARTWDDGDDGEPVIIVQLVVYFPTQDIPRLVQAFKDAPPPEDDDQE
jgi:hypothetical protein